MDDDWNLVEFLREFEKHSELYGEIFGKAANAIEAKDEEIQLLENKLRVALDAVKKDTARITRLETVMKPFKKYQTEYSDEYSKHPIIGAFLNELRQVQIVLEESDV
jgi:hypothetical protein